MAEKYQNKYRIASARARWWDYGLNGGYFITICTQNRMHYFGKIREGVMVLNEIGKLVEQYWIEIPHHFPFVALGSFVVMPNHFHGIIVIDKMDGDGDRDTDFVGTPNLGVSTDDTDDTDNPQKSIKTGGKNPNWKPGTVGVIINQYKRMVTINARKIQADFGWQSRFHDRIIRNDSAYQRIQEYIESNVDKWNEDEFSK